jgi:hypothetical protein
MIWMIAVGMVAMVGCAASDGTADEPEAPTATNEQKSATDNAHSKTNDSTPAFNPQFQPTSDTTNSDPTKDPTPSGGADECIDKDDPGATEALAKKLPDTDDCNNDLIEASGIANGGVDVDMYALSAKDKLFCELDTDFEGETAGTELCVFVRCQNSTANAVTGCDGGEETTNDIGMKGCCAAAPGKATPKWDCSGLTDNDSADFFISVKETPGTNQCLPYKFKYRF